MKHIGIMQIPELLPSQALGKIASSFYYVHYETLVEELLEFIREQGEDIPAFGVVNDKMEPIGLIDQNQLTSLLSRPFGRDVLKNRSVKKITMQRPSFKLREHILVVSEYLAEALSSKEESVFIIIDEAGHFCGTFSTLDLLTFLSDLSRQDIDLAHNVQKRIVQERQAVLTTHLEVVASSTTAKGVGGDFYAVKKIGGSTWFITICDVSGKGVAASIVTAMLHGSVETFDFSRHNLVDFVTHVNRSVFSTFEGDKFLTGIFLVFDEKSGRITILDMGHSYFGLLRGEKLLKVITSNENLPIGITPQIEPKPSTFTLLRKDILILVTDGLTEQQNLDGQEYSMTRLFSVIKTYREEGPESIRDHIRKDFNRFRGDAPYHDDVTFLIFRYPDAKEVEMDLSPEQTMQWEIA
ncbi:SpoIIE family protein phosphatase [Sediminispirochaeta bajacaliforniensis]|uniref:SpoIIE family protein phosphatase n=1 Tax=Sediminispirochaeta bajacaliforniensis TaxID=148 RepID=UPI00037088D0|nr:SpoIIE family protein phosphatase [Sediminispirochaeta bajacaliforniensis]